DGRPVSLHVGLPAHEVPTAWLGADALHDLLDGHAPVAALSASGRLVSEPAGAVVREVLEILAR
ncbi:MAG: hypothetical protein ACKOTB_00430, partial [Planctomycetia bacterium]